MVSRYLLRQYDLPPDELQRELDAAFDQGDVDWLPPQKQEFRDYKLVAGRVRKVTADAVWVDVGYKSEGVIDLREWHDEALGQFVPPQPGGVQPPAPGQEDGAPLQGAASEKQKT